MDWASPASSFHLSMRFDIYCPMPGPPCLSKTGVGPYFSISSDLSLCQLCLGILHMHCALHQCHIQSTCWQTKGSLVCVSSMWFVGDPTLLACNKTHYQYSTSNPAEPFVKLRKLQAPHLCQVQSTC